MSSVRQLPLDSTLKVGELVARDVRRRIASGDLRAGDRLPPEDALMASLGLSRTSVREGLRILESQGLIEVHRGRGGGPRITYPNATHLAPALALSLQLQDVTYRDLYEASQLIEPPLAAKLALGHTDEDIAALTEVIDRAAEAACAQDREAFAQAAADMHVAVIERAGNKTLATFSGLMRELTADYYLSAVIGPDGAQLYDRAVRSYRKFVRLVADGDAAGASEHWAKQLAFTSREMAGQDRVISFL